MANGGRCAVYGRACPPQWETGLTGYSTARTRARWAPGPNFGAAASLAGFGSAGQENIPGRCARHPAGGLRQQADRIAQLYNHLDSPVTPQTIVALRVNLREVVTPAYWRGLETETGQESGSSTGETEKESRAAGPKALRSQQIKRTKNSRGKPTRKPRLDPRDIRDLSTIPSRARTATSASVTEQGVQTLSRRRQGVTGNKPKTMVQRQHELHGDEQNGHSSRDSSPTPAASRKCTQTGKRRRVKDCDVEQDPERDIEAFRMWISPAATARLDNQMNTRSRETTTGGP